MDRSHVIQHLIDHYIARDLFRVEAHHLLMRAGQPYTATHVVTEWGRGGTAPRFISLEHNVIARTRKSLERSSDKTLNHLHDLLHKEPVLDGDEHVHIGDDLFVYVIEEVDDAMPLLSSLG